MVFMCSCGYPLDVAVENENEDFDETQMAAPGSRSLQWWQKSSSHDNILYIVILYYRMSYHIIECHIISYHIIYMLYMYTIYIYIYILLLGWGNTSTTDAENCASAARWWDAKPWRGNGPDGKPIFYRSKFKAWCLSIHQLVCKMEYRHSCMEVHQKLKHKDHCFYDSQITKRCFSSQKLDPNCAAFTAKSGHCSLWIQQSLPVPP